MRVYDSAAIKYKLLSGELIFIFFALQIIALLISAFQIVYLGIDANSIISGPAADLPDIRVEAFKEPRQVGIHFFGDFLQTFDWASVANPWTEGFDQPVVYPSFPVYMMKFFHLFPYFFSLFLYLAAMIVTSTWIAWALMPSFKFGIRLFSSISLGLASGPALMAFDRGNNTGFFALLFGLFLMGVLQNRRMLMSISFALMVAIKIYPLILMVIFIRKKMWKELVTSLSAVLAVSGILFLITPGDPFQTLAAFVNANLEFSKYWQKVAGLGLEAIFRLIGIDATALNSNLEIFVSIIFLGKFLAASGFAFYALVARSASSISAVMLCAFAMTLLHPAPLGYGWTWAIPTVAVLLNRFRVAGLAPLDANFESGSVRFEALMLVSLLFTLLPFPLALPGTEKSVMPLAGSFLVFLCATWLMASGWRKIR